uniref:Uncharacterized protein n=1 Tax=Rhinolophus ferrumequinum TaxID=59479 RepID=A0A671G4G5_RHIFE
MASAVNPWNPASAPNAAGLLLGHFHITNIQAEINEKNLEIELLKLEKDTADAVHASFLDEVSYSAKYMAQLLKLAVTFIERLETHLETIKNIPHSKSKENEQSFSKDEYFGD